MLLVTWMCTAQILDIDAFLERCPTNDPAFPTISSDFGIRVDGVLVSEFSCSEPISSIPVEDYTDALIVLQTLRTIYYMDRHMAGHLPWTDGNLYDWMKAEIAGINIKDGVVGGYCCEIYEDGLYFVIGAADEFSRDFDRTWEGISGNISFYSHERRHADPSGYPHVSCCGIPGGCDQTYTEADLGAYGIQWWLNWAWLTGTINVGIGCLDPSRVTSIANWHQGACSTLRSRICDDPPAEVSIPESPGGECLQAADTAAVFRLGSEGAIFADGVFAAVSFAAGAADVAEWVAISEPVAPGDVVELDPLGTLTYRLTGTACSSLVAGIVSTEPGIVLAEDAPFDSRALLALTGIVPVKVTNEGGPIHPGDLLASSSTPGHAMRWAGPEPCPCALVGKALEPMTDDVGLILVLLMAH